MQRFLKSVGMEAGEKNAKMVHTKESLRIQLCLGVELSHGEDLAQKEEKTHPYVYRYF